MPHCVLEYSSNIIDPIDTRAFFLELHQTIIKSGPFNLDQIKSRAFCRDEFVVGDGSPDKSFVYLQISILSGRDKDIRTTLSQRSLKLLERYFPKTRATGTCSMTVEIREMDKETHLRAEKAT